MRPARPDAGCGHGAGPRLGHAAAARGRLEPAGHGARRPGRARGRAAARDRPVGGEPRCRTAAGRRHRRLPLAGSVEPDADGRDGPACRRPAAGRADRNQAAADARVGQPAARRGHRAGRARSWRRPRSWASSSAVRNSSPTRLRWLYERTAGNALFVGEIMRMLGAGGRISRLGDRLRIDRAAAQRSVPLSLRALLGARIDALPPGPVRRSLSPP